MKRTMVILTLVGLLVSFTGCPKNDTTPVGPDAGTGTITFGSVTTVGSGSIGSGGGSVNVTGGTLNGLSIQVPAGAFSGGRSFVISTAAINSHTFGSDFNVLTPLIRIDNGGGYADSVMTLTIPCTVPKGHYAMAFYYDEETGELEGIPPVAINDNSITVAARHFSAAKLSDGRKGTSVQGTKTWVDVIVASMLASNLFAVQESGFRPSIDDWEFANYGSYIAGGHCTGQSVTAMWYYSARKQALKEANLNGRFNKVAPNIWQANRNGFRFCSVVWADQNVGRRVAWMNKFNNVGGTRFSHDSLHYLAFAYAIHMTKKPQLVEIWNSTSGHAMVVYKANMKVLSISDPNFPGSYSHLINLGSDGTFAPYESKPSANDPSVFYPQITYVAKSALFDLSSITARYAEMQAGTIGTVAPNTFPETTLQWYNGTSWVVATDTIMTDQDTILFCAQCPTCFYDLPNKLTYLTLVDMNGKDVANSDAKGYLPVPLKSGLNTVPLYIQGSPDAKYWKYIDFKMPVVKKIAVANYTYWLRGIDDSNDSVSFGAKDGMIPLYGYWNGNTYHCDTTIQMTENGTTYTVKEKLNAVCNAAKTMVTSYTVEVSLQGMAMISVDGANLPLKTSDNSSMTFAVSGKSTCSTLTRVTFNFWGTVKSWFCADDSFVTLVLPK